MFFFFVFLVYGVIFVDKVRTYDIVGTGASFAENIYKQAQFAYKFVSPDDNMVYTAIGSSAGKCNIMGFWTTSNVDSDGPTNILALKEDGSSSGVSIKANDGKICSDTCTEQSPCYFNNTDPTQPGLRHITPATALQNVTWRANRSPLKDYIGSDSILGIRDYTNYPDLQMLPALAGPVVPIYNIPELYGITSTLILSRGTIAKIFRGKIRSWNDPLIRADNVGQSAILDALQTVTTNITIVVRNDGSGTSTQIFTKALSFFEPSDFYLRANGYDTNFNSSVGQGEKPSWCGPVPDEIQQITLGNCSSGGNADFVHITTVFTFLSYSVSCLDTVDSLQDRFNAMPGNVVAVISRTASSDMSLITFKIAYQFVGNALYTKYTNWYLPILTNGNGHYVTTEALQEGSFSSTVYVSHYNYPQGFISEVQSIFINANIAQSFKLIYNGVESALISVSGNGTINALSTAISNAVVAVCGTAVNVNMNMLTISAKTCAATCWVEYQITFVAGNTLPSMLKTNATVDGGVYIALLRRANNVMKNFYDNFHASANITSDETNFGNNYGIPKLNAGFYCCYRRQDNYDKWCYDTGNTNTGTVSEVMSYPYSISYAGLYDSVRNNIAVARMINKAGTIVTASKTSTSFAVLELGGGLDRYMNAWLVDGSTLKVWPIVGYTYFVVRKMAHRGSCKDRQQAMSYLYDFYNSKAVSIIAGTLGFATLPGFVSDIVRNVLVEEVMCDDLNFALEKYRQQRINLIASELIAAPLTTYLAVYQTNVTSELFEIDRLNSNAAWNSFISSDPSIVAGVFTSFTTAAQKSEKYNDPNILTMPFANFAVAFIYHVSFYQMVTSSTLVFNAKILTGILIGKIQYWNDSSIAALLPSNITMPYRRIRVVVRNDECDENAVISRYLGIISNNIYSDEFKTLYDVSSNGNGLMDWSKAISKGVSFIFQRSSSVLVDNTVLHFDNTIGVYALVGAPSSQVSRFCNDESCSDPPISLINNSASAINQCQLSPESSVQLLSGYSYDLMLSKANLCYPMSSTVDYSIFKNPNVTTCKAESVYKNGIAKLRTHFSSWLFNPDASFLTSPLHELQVNAASEGLRITSYGDICDVKCSSGNNQPFEAMGYEFCRYRDCTWVEGDYDQTVFPCNPLSQTRRVAYTLNNKKCRSGVHAINPEKEPKSNVEIACTAVENGSVLGITSYVLAIIGSIFSVVCLLVSYAFRKESVMKRSQPMLMYPFMVGALLMNLSMLVFIGQNTDISCLLRPWFSNISSAIMFAPLLLNLLRIEYLVLNGIKRSKFSNQSALLMCLAIVAVDVVILSIWTVVDKPAQLIIFRGYSETLNSVQDKVCTTQSIGIFETIMILWKALVVGFGVLKAITTWRVSADISEAKYSSVAVAIYFIAFQGSVSYFISVLVAQSSVEAAVFLRTIGLFSCSTFAVFLVVIPKVTIVISSRGTVKSKRQVYLIGSGSGGIQSLNESEKSSLVEALADDVQADSPVVQGTTTTSAKEFIANIGDNRASFLGSFSLSTPGVLRWNTRESLVLEEASSTGKEQAGTSSYANKPLIVDEDKDNGKRQDSGDV